MYCFLYISLSFPSKPRKKRHEVAISPFCMTAKNAIDEINCKCRNGRNESVLTTTFEGVVLRKSVAFSISTDKSCVYLIALTGTWSRLMCRSCENFWEHSMSIIWWLHEMESEVLLSEYKWVSRLKKSLKASDGFQLLYLHDSCTHNCAHIHMMLFNYNPFFWHSPSALYGIVSSSSLIWRLHCERHFSESCVDEIALAERVRGKLHWFDIAAAANIVRENLFNHSTRANSPH